MSSFRVFFSIAALLIAPNLWGQRENQVPPPEENEYGAKFFVQLSSIFGRFRDADLKRVFQTARPIQCSELVTDKGEWREVAFFNENRKLGDWYRTNLAELKDDFSGYIFKGVCGGQRRPVQVTTRFPVDESIKAYQEGKIRFQEIDVNVNAPVSAVFDPQSEAYVFDLPYLYRVANQSGDPIYTLNPRRASDRYAAGVMNRWECKSVKAEDVTYQFLICHTALLPRGGPASDQRASASFGSSAYSILSDGKEASSSVKLTFGPADSTPETAGARTPPPPPDERRAPPGRAWRAVASQARLIDIGESEFRLRFAAEGWKERIGKPQLIADGLIANSTATSPPPRNKDYCAWRPGALTNQLLETSPSDSIVHTLEFRKDAQSVVSVFEMQNDAGLVLGVLQCFFRQSQTPGDIVVSGWLSVVGTNITLEAPAP